MCSNVFGLFLRRHGPLILCSRVACSLLQLFCLRERSLRPGRPSQSSTYIHMCICVGSHEGSSPSLLRGSRRAVSLLVYRYRRQGWWAPRGSVDAGRAPGCRSAGPGVGDPIPRFGMVVHTGHEPCSALQHRNLRVLLTLLGLYSYGALLISGARMIMFCYLAASSFWVVSGEATLASGKRQCSCTLPRETGWMFA